MAPSQLGLFTRSDPGEERANLQYHVQPLSLDRFGEPLHRFPAFTASVANLRPTSRGHVRLRGRDPASAPAIKPNYLSTDEDRRIAADAIRLTRAYRRRSRRSRRIIRPNICRALGCRRRRAGLAEGRGRHRHDHLSSGRHRENGPCRAIR